MSDYPYKVDITARGWVGKRDPSGFGTFTFHGSKLECERHAAWCERHGMKAGPVVPK